MVSTSSQLLLSFFLSFGPAVIIGAGNYVLVRLAYDKVPDFEEVASLPSVLLFFLCALPLALLASLIFLPLLLLFPLSVLGAYADKSISTEQDTLGWHFWRLCVAVVVSLVDALLLYLIVSVGKVPLFTYALFSGTACLVGFLTGPIMAPIFIWLWRSSQLRPGIDRHLDSSEELNSRS